MIGELYDKELDRTLEDNTERRQADIMMTTYGKTLHKDNRRNKSGMVQHTKV